jgi:hypothetical protein
MPSFVHYYDAYAQVQFYVQSGILVQDAMFLACNWGMFIVLGLFVVFLYPPMQKMQYFWHVIGRCSLCWACS